MIYPSILQAAPRPIYLLAPLLVLTACAWIEPAPPAPSGAHIKSAPFKPPAAEIPELVGPLPVLPAPGEPQPAARYTVVVNAVPVAEVLFALARDARINVDIHPDISGRVTLNAVDQTLPQLLRRIARQVDLRYQFEDGNLILSRDTPYLRSYQIDYVNMSRRMSSANTLATQITAATGGGVSAGAGATAGVNSGGNYSTTDVASESVNRFWETTVRNVASIIGARAADPAAAAANIIAAPESGLLTVRATTAQHRDIQEFIDLSMTRIKRQVLIRATIAEVQLSQDYQAGVDWSLVNRAGQAGFNIISRTLGGVPVGTASSFVINYADPNRARAERLSATVRLLDEFGDTRILSSPQLMVLNNQTALLKVIENIVYFKIDAETTPGATNRDPVTTVDTSAQTVPVGIVMSVTPQISAAGDISLNVRPTISRITRFVNDPNPNIPVGRSNPVPQIQIREMESMLRLADGQIAVLGGLMQDQSSAGDSGLPGIKKLPGIGPLFKRQTSSAKKTELVIFLQPFVVTTPALQADLRHYEEYLNSYPRSQPPGLERRLSMPGESPN